MRPASSANVCDVPLTLDVSKQSSLPKRNVTGTISKTVRPEERTTYRQFNDDCPDLSFSPTSFRNNGRVSTVTILRRHQSKHSGHPKQRAIEGLERVTYVRPKYPRYNTAAEPIRERPFRSFVSLSGDFRFTSYTAAFGAPADELHACISNPSVLRRNARWPPPIRVRREPIVGYWARKNGRIDERL